MELVMKKVGILVLAFMANFSASAAESSIADQITNVCAHAPGAVVSQKVQEAYKAYKEKFKPDPNVDDAALPNDQKCFGNVREELNRLYPDTKE
jgi:hypothetical protein